MYVLDANVFIGAHRGYYDFDVAPSFWKSLISQASKNNIRSIDKIQDEIISPDPKNADRLHLWTADNFKSYFERTDSQDVIEKYAEIQQWAHSNPQFTPSAKEEFAHIADAWLVAYAKSKDYTLVTHEAYNPDIKKRILIPVVCRQFNVKYVNTFEMLRNLKVSF
ncbi:MULTISPECIES: DUF4411 family protein [unclassified Paenibacillus]|uniref:DUF4411 family protein n=1 Tax=unclassified Paenibacillus TaxID=185978 RepID=UPI001C1283BA|nr:MULTISPECIES: DUF4411 family protein [unclassified Paenibacillus]MBU5442444.1 DUF4411 family protein [Paenibacillus sp. MSJ-34]CAH0122650.1 hypothetical protein PAE9249_05222 [Paenibacillus sp. CECT 9249]